MALITGLPELSIMTSWTDILSERWRYYSRLSLSPAAYVTRAIWPRDLSHISTSTILLVTQFMTSLSRVPLCCKRGGAWFFQGRHKCWPRPKFLRRFDNEETLINIPFSRLPYGWKETKPKVILDSNPYFRINPYSDPDVRRIATKMLWITLSASVISPNVVKISWWVVTMRKAFK